jgi:hypothetical protein
MSGYTEAAALEHAKIGTEAILLNKPFSAEMLATKIRELQQKQPQQKSPLPEVKAATGSV